MAGEADVDVALIAIEYGDGRGLRRDVSVVVNQGTEFADKENPCGEIATVGGR